MTIQAIMPYLAPLVIVILLYFRTRRAYRVRAGGLVIAPLLVTAMIGSAIWFQPHEPFALPAYAGFGIAVLAGVGIGMLRARSIAMWRDESGQVMAKASSLALLLLAVLFIARTAMRQVFDPAGTHVAVVDAFLLFALAMVLTQRLIIWQRHRSLTGAV